MKYFIATLVTCCLLSISNISANNSSSLEKGTNKIKPASQNNFIVNLEHHILQNKNLTTGLFDFNNNLKALETASLENKYLSISEPADMILMSCLDQYYPSFLICVGWKTTTEAGAYASWCFKVTLIGIIGEVLATAGMTLPEAVIEAIAAAEACGVMAYGAAGLVGIVILSDCVGSLIENVVACHRGKK